MTFLNSSLEKKVIHVCQFIINQSSYFVFIDVMVRRYRLLSRGGSRWSFPVKSTEADVAFRNEGVSFPLKDTSLCRCCNFWVGSGSGMRTCGLSCIGQRQRSLPRTALVSVLGQLCGGVPSCFWLFLHCTIVKDGREQQFCVIKLLFLPFCLFVRTLSGLWVLGSVSLLLYISRLRGTGGLFISASLRWDYPVYGRVPVNKECQLCMDLVHYCFSSVAKVYCHYGFLLQTT